MPNASKLQYFSWFHTKFREMAFLRTILYITILKVVINDFFREITETK